MVHLEGASSAGIYCVFFQDIWVRNTYSRGSVCFRRTEHNVTSNGLDRQLQLLVDC